MTALETRMSETATLIDHGTEALKATGPALDAARPYLDNVLIVLEHGYGIVQDLMPLIVLLLFLLMLRTNRQIRDIARRQEQQTRVLVKLLNLHPDSDYQQFLRVAEKRAEERAERRDKHPDLLS